MSKKKQSAKPQPEAPSLKLKTARTLKWNTVDKLSQQVLYAVTGIVLANILSQEDFGLVGAIMVFQAFATLFVDSGFSNALVQRKDPTATDYSTIFWFNLGVSVAIYMVLWFAAPLIDTVFHADGRLVPMSRVMFLTFIVNATALVQTNRLIKQMNVKMVAVSNVIGLVVSGALGIWLALDGYGAWAIVWQSLSLAAVKSIVLWITTGWRPLWEFSMASLRSIFKVGAGVMTGNLLNVTFQNIYSFIIGAFYNLAQLGCYTQADKWSKMGVASLSSILNTTFLPVLSGVQDDRERFYRMMSKINRLSAYMVLPCMGLLFATAPAIFHVLFQDKWDAAIVLFQLLAVRGVFTIMSSVYSTYILAIGNAKQLVHSEVVKCVVIAIAIAVTVPYGIKWLVVGQLVAGVVCYVYNAVLVYKVTGYHWALLINEIMLFALVTVLALFPASALGLWIESDYLLLPAQIVVGGGIYLALNALLRSAIQREVLGYAFGRFASGKQDKSGKRGR